VRLASLGYEVQSHPSAPREKFNVLAEQSCISCITLGELHNGAESSARRTETLTAIQHFVARLEVLPFGKSRRTLRPVVGGAGTRGEALWRA
jgi:predicted nucleic acid-binding protein